VVVRAVTPAMIAVGCFFGPDISHIQGRKPEGLSLRLYSAGKLMVPMKRMIEKVKLPAAVPLRAA